MSGHDDLRDLAFARGLGRLDEPDRIALDEHLAGGCEGCEQILANAVAVGDALLEAAEPVAPSPELGAQLMERARRDEAHGGREAPPRAAGASRTTRFGRAAGASRMMRFGRAAGASRMMRFGRAAGTSRMMRFGRAAGTSRVMRFALAASLVLAVGSGLGAALLARSLEAQRGVRAELEAALSQEQEARRALVADLARERGERGRLRVALEGLRDTLGIVGAPRTRVVTLDGQGPAPEAAARAYLEPGAGRLILFVDDLPPLPPGQTYQLWVIIDSQPRSAGVFSVDSGGRAQHDTRAVRDFGASPTVAVTVEPAGGVPQPTGEIVLVGSKAL